MLKQLSTQQTCVVANIEMMAKLADQIAARFQTARDDAENGQFNAAVGGITGLDEILKNMSALYGATLIAHRTPNY